MATSLICRETQSRVSSTLNRDAKQFGKKYMFDSNEETCWNSDQGENQWVALEFPKNVKMSELKVQFQGGFSGRTCRLEGCVSGGEFTALSQFYPEDNNSLQSFPIQEVPAVSRLKIVFEDSSDFFGRIIVYSLEILGERAS
ncbi:nuclear receptor 2C2-associated protein [Gadus morhua]|uniref:Nuclear receptor 2C2-associated protein n=1 Tax=Gadus morhua TaxID=8049 RepID=A0A8C5FXG8_GADMO|nr:nuclear receptor 2C2-associated protein [Gadus morhua]XP_056459453.1 nuclear receptor 2C2-associated protein [Gadus chalcogrammus]